MLLVFGSLPICPTKRHDEVTYADFRQLCEHLWFPDKHKHINLSDETKAGKITFKILPKNSLTLIELLKVN